MSGSSRFRRSHARPAGRLLPFAAFAAFAAFAGGLVAAARSASKALGKFGNPGSLGSVAAAISCLLLLSAPAAAQPQPAQPQPAQQQPTPTLSLSMAMTLAEQNSQALPAQDAAARAASARAIAAGQLPDPMLRLGLDNVPFEGSLDSVLTREPTTARSIGLVQALPRAAKRQARAQLFEREADLAMARRALERRRLRREAALAWVQAYVQGQRLQQIEAQRVQAELLREAVDAAYRAARASQTEPFVARLALGRLQDQRLQALAEQQLALASLRRWVGAAADWPLDQAPDWQRSSLDSPQAAAWLTQDPELALTQAQQSQAGAAVNLAREDLRPDWSVDLRVAQRGPRYDNMVSIGLSLPLRWDVDRRQGREVAARMAQQQQAEADSEEVKRARDTQVERWRLSWQIGLRRLQTYQQELLPLAAARTQAALASYRAGSGPLQAVLEARVAEQALRLEQVQIEGQTASDWIRLETLLPPATTPILEQRP